jgi:hypothetical protein
MDEFYDFAIPRTAYDAASGLYYEQKPEPLGADEKTELRQIWDRFQEIRTRIEAIGETAPSLTKLWSRRAAEHNVAAEEAERRARDAA